jgi:glycosyltransferase involved in cell wall biosynthesis
MKSKGKTQGLRSRNCPAKLLCVTPFSWLYGDSLSLLSLVTALDRSEFEPFVITTGHGPLVSRLTESAVPNRSIRMPQASRHGKEAVDFITSLFPISIDLARFIRANHIDIVYNNTLLNPYGALAARLAGVPCIWHIREIVKESYYRKLMIKATTMLADELVVVSRATAGLYSEKEQKRLNVIYNGVDTNYFSPAAIDAIQARKELGIDINRPVVGIISRLHKSKRHSDILKAVRMLKEQWPQILLVIVGDGPLLDQLRREVDEYGLNDQVLFLGYQEDVRKSLAAFDIFVLPSEHEAFGRAVIEAMAMAKPVIGTSVGGLPELITEETGFLVPVAQPTLIASAISKLLTYPEIAVQMGMKGRSRAVNTFSVKTYVKNMTNLLRNSLLPKTKINEVVEK